MTDPAPQPGPQPAPQPQPQPASQPEAARAPSPVPEVPEARDGGTGGDENVDARLTQAVSDAYTLLDFACRQGDPPPGDISKTLIGAFETVNADKPLSPSDETTFWSAFAHITQSVRPVTVDSILFTMPPPHPTGEAHQRRPRNLIARALKPTSPAEKVLRHYLAAALGTLLVLLVLQMEWAIGTYIYNDAYKVHRYLQQAQTHLLEAEQNHANAKGTPGADQAVRALAADIDRVALTANDLYSMRTRVILGVISGVCMAWLYIITGQPVAGGTDRGPIDAISFLGAFAPWAVAFISGYSVEIFFALLERLVTLATTKIKGLDAGEPKRAAPPAKPTPSSQPQAQGQPQGQNPGQHQGQSQGHPQPQAPPSPAPPG